jgi:hypothetical protein
MRSQTRSRRTLRRVPWPISWTGIPSWVGEIASDERRPLTQGRARGIGRPVGYRSQASAPTSRTILPSRTSQMSVPTTRSPVG